MAFILQVGDYEYLLMPELYFAEPEADLPYSPAIEIADSFGRRLSSGACRASLLTGQFLEDNQRRGGRTLVCFPISTLSRDCNNVHPCDRRRDRDKRRSIGFAPPERQ